MSGTQTLVARGLYRPEITLLAATRQVFQLHPNGWKFAEGHVAKLELLPADQPYGRNSNGQTPITVSNLELRLPVLEQPSCGGVVQDPAPKVVPAGYTLTADAVSAAEGCSSCALAGCRRSVEPGRGTLFIKDKPGLIADRLTFKWTHGATTAKADFGSPLADTDYRVCVYDDSTLVTKGHAPSGGLCNGRPCWRETNSGFKYRSRELTIVLKEGIAGHAKIGVTGKGGTNPPLPALPLPQPATVQVVNDDGICWESTFSAPANVNDGVKFKDKAD